MKRNKTIYAVFFVTFALGMLGCKDQLDVGNPNAPTVTANINNETGLVSFAQGAVYINGFLNGNAWLGDSYFSLPWGYSELLADNVGADASNNQITTIGVPDYIILDNGTKVSNSSSSSVGIIRSYNTRAATGANNNAIYYQWLNMYALNNACNQVLELSETIEFAGDAESRKNTIKAWCYWWKGFAYASIGSMYYAGVIANEAGKSSNDYVLHDVILAESDKYYNLAATTLSSITSIADYTNVLGKLIPSYCQVGAGGVLTTDMWKRNINTMLARNIMLNKLSPFVNGNPAAAITKSSTSAMTAADWNNVKTLATNGIRATDFVFTGRTTGANDFFTASGGTVAALTSSVNTSSTFKISERFMQNFKATDKRLANNFNTATTYKNNYTYTTRFSITDGGNDMPNVHIYATKEVGEYELLISGTYEENALMLAEANIRLGDLETGLGLVDVVRDYFGAGVAHIAGTGLTLSQALTELVKERRVALVFRGLSFYDSRRWGWTYDESVGGGTFGNTIVQADGTVNTNAKIIYNFMDYWDIPADETVLNPPSVNSVAVLNPNYE